MTRQVRYLKIRDIIKSSIEQIRDISSTPLLDSELMAAKALDRDRLYVIIHMDEQLEEETAERIQAMVEERKNGRPLQYITGHQEFMGLDFYVSEGVLIPRPDTEVLVEKVIELASEFGSPKILDIGCGSGAISVSLAKYVESSKVWSLDISKRALEIGRKNATDNGVADRIEFIESDLFQKLEGTDIEFEIIVSNPPYIRRADIEDLHVQVKDYEPAGALDGGIDGLDFYRKIVERGRLYLISGGYMAFEVGHDQAAEVALIMENSSSFENISIYKDLPGIDRVVIGKKI